MKLKRFWLLATLLALAIIGTLALSAHAHAQNDSVLKLPPGAKIALIVFEDLECPECARSNPLLEKASQTYKIPLVRHDFPLPMHAWAFDAAILEHFFDRKSKVLGDEFRDYIFQHQAEVTKDNLRSVAEKFALEHKTALPFAVDPQGKLAGEVKADQALGERVGIHYTPTIYLVSNSHTSPVVEVADKRQLFQMIDALKAESQ